MGIQVSPPLAALTTIWEPPTTCKSYTFYGGTDGFGGPGMRGNAVATDCYPDLFVTDTVYSPGVCPSGWAYRGAPSTNSEWSSIFPSSLTVRQCCPGTMVPRPGIEWEWCHAILPSNTFYTFWSTGPDVTVGTEMVTSWTTDGAVYARPIMVAYEATDTEIFTLLPKDDRPRIVSSTEPSPGATGPATATSTSSSTSSPTPTAAGNTDGGGLSKGVKAGIGAGVAIFVISAALLVGLCFWKRRRHQTGLTRDATGAYEPNQGSMYLGDQSPELVQGHQSPELGQETKNIVSYYKHGDDEQRSRSQETYKLHSGMQRLSPQEPHVGREV